MPTEPEIFVKYLWAITLKYHLQLVFMQKYYFKSTKVCRNYSKISALDFCAVQCFYIYSIGGPRNGVSVMEVY